MTACSASFRFLDRRRAIRGVLAFLAVTLACIANVAFAQGAYPGKPIRLIVGFAPGGAADIIARIVGEHLGRALGQPLIIDNRPGAGSSLAVELVARANPDGYTILIASQSGMIVNPVINRNIGYNVEKDFAPIIQVSSSPLVAAVHPSLPVRTLAELISEAKRAPGKLNFSTSGSGSMPHLALMLFGALAGVDMVHVPYKSGGLSVQSVLAGDTQVTFATAPSVMPLVQAGRLRGLAVTTRARSPLVPGLPGMEEAGLANYDVSIWYGFFAPAATPPEVIRRLFDASVLVLQKPEVRQALARDGTEAPGSRSPEDFGAFVREEAKLMARLIRESGAKID